MRLLHLVSEPGPSGRGVPQKVVRTVEVWRKLGVEADFVDLATGRLGFDGIADSDRNVVTPSRRSGWIREMDRRGRRLSALLDRVRPDVIYTRELVWAPAIESIFRRHRVVVEINSDRAQELRRASRAAATFWRLTAGRLLRRAAGVVAVTSELEDRLAPRDVPRLLVFNGTTVPETMPVRRPEPDAPLVSMLVGGPGSWQGVDRLGTLAERLPDIRFVVCGDPGSEGEALPRSVQRLPPLVGSDLRDLLARSAACIGTLALSRKRMTEACPLKSRTALAAGVPLIYAYDDPVLSGDESFALRVADRDCWSSEDVARIEAFVHRASTTPEMSETAWRFARAHLDVSAIEQRRLDFMRSLLPR
jgi:hypothetical protein